MAVATSTTSSAQPMEAAVVARADLRAVNRIAMPRRAMITGTHEANRLSWSADETRSIIGSNTRRKVGCSAARVIDEVSAEKAMGTIMIQLAIAVPITASGWRARSGPHPRSYVCHLKPA